MFLKDHSHITCYNCSILLLPIAVHLLLYLIYKPNYHQFIHIEIYWKSHAGFRHLLGVVEHASPRGGYCVLYPKALSGKANWASWLSTATGVRTLFFLHVACEMGEKLPLSPKTWLRPSKLEIWCCFLTDEHVWMRTWGSLGMCQGCVLTSEMVPVMV